MKDPWEKAYVYGRSSSRAQVVHVLASRWPLCDIDVWCPSQNRTAKPYPVCKNCLRTKRAKELGL